MVGQVAELVDAIFGCVSFDENCKTQTRSETNMIISTFNAGSSPVLTTRANEENSKRPFDLNAVRAYGTRLPFRDYIH